MLTIEPREGKVGDDLFQDDPRWLAVNNVAASVGFSKAPRLSQLLLYLATQALSGRGADVTEAELASVVFERGRNFDPAADTIVRSHMLRLRQRLAQADCASTSYVISLPKGQYALCFEKLDQTNSLQGQPLATEPARLSQEAPAIVALPSTAKSSSPRSLYVLFVLLLLIAGTDLVLRLRNHPSDVAPNPLWDSLFTPDKTTTFLAADSSLVLLHHYMQREPTLDEYVSGRFRQEAEELYRAGVEPSGLFERRYTSIADLKMTGLLGEIAGERHIRMRTVFARDMTLDDLKQSNVILSGSKGANPWLELFEPQLNFIIESSAQYHATVVTNRHPRDGEQAVYLSGVGAAPATYGVLAFIPGIEPSTNVLILEGTSVAGTESIYDLLSDNDEVKELLKQFRTSDGRLKHLEILLSSQSLNASAAEFHVVASRSYP